MTFSGPLEDRVAIRELHGTYADAAFRADKQQWVDCWTEDAVWHTTLGEMRGKEALARQWDEIWAMMESLGFFVTVGAIEVTGDRATSRCYVREVFPHRDGPIDKIVGRYDDELVRQDGAWRFASRRYAVLIREPGA